ncbi:MAG: LLM class flavin-dependent oxidoreductase [Thermomicrobiales bacterium]
MHDLRFGIWTSQSKPWNETLDEWKLVEQLGFDCAGIVDHFMPTAGDEDGWFHEGWTLLAALAALVPRIRLSILVTGNTYRNPVLLAKEAATVDHVSGGRLDLGVGAGWYAREHEAYGWELGSGGQRVDMLDEALEIINSLFTDQRTNFRGEYYSIHDAPFQPKPVQEKLPIMIGAQKPRMLGLVAKHADIWNLNHGPEKMKEFGATLVESCERIGRDPAEIRWSAFAMRSVLDRDPFDSVDDFRSVTEQYLDAGATEIYYRMPETDEGRDVLRQVPEVFTDYR